VGPFGAAIVHELHLFFPATLREQHDRGGSFLLQVEAQLGANPLRGAIHALPLNALAGNRPRRIIAMATPNHALARFEGFNVHVKDGGAPVKAKHRRQASNGRVWNHDRAR
jgi:hypothetical protein